MTTRKAADEQPEETPEEIDADDAEQDPTVIDESPADDEGNRPERDREDPNTYPDPDNPSRTP